MTRFLLIDTCTERGVIALGNQLEVFFEKELPYGPLQSKSLIPYLSELILQFALPTTLDAIGVGVGPGSYTGIRLGVSAAQALAYAWKLPLVGVCSLEGFVPVGSEPRYAAILDARIGGVYLQTGCLAKGKSVPRVCSLDEAGRVLEEFSHLVTPNSKSLKTKLKERCPAKEWEWEERAPSSKALLRLVENNYHDGVRCFPPEKLELLYLRETEAERERQRRAAI